MVMNESEMTLSQRQADGADGGVTASPPREIAGERPLGPAAAAVAALGRPDPGRRCSAVWGWRHYRQPADAPASGDQQTAAQAPGGKRGDNAARRRSASPPWPPRDIHVVINALGTVTPIATVTVVSQISGYLQSVAFTEGQHVKKGDVLAQIDPRPYQALKAQYEGQLAHDQGLLDQAQVDDARYQTLLKQNSIAAQTARGPEIRRQAI